MSLSGTVKINERMAKYNNKLSSFMISLSFFNFTNITEARNYRKMKRKQLSLKCIT